MSGRCIIRGVAVGGRYRFWRPESHLADPCSAVSDSTPGGGRAARDGEGGQLPHLAVPALGPSHDAASVLSVIARLEGKVITLIERRVLIPRPAMVTLRRAHGDGDGQRRVGERTAGLLVAVP